MALQDIHDTNPERRNLVFLSLAIILYYLAGGGLVGEEVKLHVINIEFTNPDVITIFMWVMLAWFCLRYWQTNRGKYIHTFRGEMESLSNTWLLRLYASKIFGIEYNKENGFNHAKLSYQKPYWLISCQKIKCVTYNEDNVLIGSEHAGWTDAKNFKGVWATFILIILKTYTVITKPAFAAYIVPYLLFSTAVILHALSTYNLL